MKKAFLALAIAIALAGGVRADDDHDDKQDSDRFEFKPGTLVVTRSKYVGTSSLLVPGVTLLPPGCPGGSVTVALIGGGVTPPIAVPCSTPTYDGTFPYVFNNAAADSHFGITSPIFLDNLTTDGHRLGTLAVPTDQIVTSFSSKSELAVHLSTDGKSITFVGYRGGTGFLTGVNIFDVSNGNTPGLIDPTNAAVGQYYRSVAEVDAHGHLMVTEGNAYSGDNGRGAVKGGSLYYLVGNDNSGNLSKKQVTTTVVGEELVNSTGAELLVPGQAPPFPTNKIGDFEINQVTNPVTGTPYALDKAGKDNNYRGITIYSNTLYITKGSGGNGINTVYQVGTAGILPTGDIATLANVPITILPGLPATLASGVDSNGNPTPVSYPFGIWFADANTLYVGDEGDGYAGGTDLDTHAAAQTGAGLEKWVYSSTTKTWSLAYTIQAGLKLGQPYTVADYPTGLNLGTCFVSSPTLPNPNNCPVSNPPVDPSISAPDGLPWAPATDGLRNLTGRVNEDGTATIWAVTSTVSGSGDQGADPNHLVMVTDRLAATTVSKGDGDYDKDDRLDHFVTIRSAKSGEVLRGVAFAPQDRDGDDSGHHDGN